MNEAEIVLNLWTYYDMDTRAIYALSGKAYSISGSDDEKLQQLQTLASADYVTTIRHPVPERLSMIGSGGEEKSGITTAAAHRDPNAQLFEELFRLIESELPPRYNFTQEEGNSEQLKLPQDPLCCTTLLYENEFGNIRPIITKEDAVWAKEQEENYGRDNGS